MQTLFRYATQFEQILCVVVHSDFRMAFPEGPEWREDNGRDGGSDDERTACQANGRCDCV